MLVDKITKQMWRAAMLDKDEAHELILIMEVLTSSGIEPITHVSIGGKSIPTAETTSGQAHKIICAMCPEWAKDS